MSARAACTVPTGWAATRCQTCWCSAVAPGLGAADYVRALASRPGGLRGGRRVRRRAGAAALQGPARAPRRRTRTPCTPDLQQTMNDLVGIIRTDEEIQPGAGQDRRVQGPPCSNIESTADRSSTRAGTWPSTCATCCWSASASQGRAGAHREPGRTYPRRLPGDGPRVAAHAAGLPRDGRRRGARSVGHQEVQPPMREDLLEVSRSTNSVSTSPTMSWPSTRDGGASELSGEAEGLARRRRGRRAARLHRRGQRG